VKSLEEVKHGILEETVRRELKEECGVEVEDFVLLNNHAFRRFDGHYCLMVVFLAKFKSSKKIELDPEEIIVIHWLKFDLIDKERMYKTVYRIYKMANEKIGKLLS